MNAAEAQSYLVEIPTRLAEITRERDTHKLALEQTRAALASEQEANAKLRAALSLCRDWLESYRPHEANRKSDKANEAVIAARAALKGTP